MENMHIIFWLLKDVAWCLVWKPLAVAMIVPTLIISIVIAYRTREIKSELAHNLAITFWISANATWMVTEFFAFDTVPLWGPFTGKHIALVPFIIGILLLAKYYFFQRRKEESSEQAVTF
jgi:L-asparagine transporter-like permease